MIMFFLAAELSLCVQHLPVGACDAACFAPFYAAANALLLLSQTRRRLLTLLLPPSPLLLSPRHLVTLLQCHMLKPEFEAETVLPLASMPLNEVGQCFSVLRRPAGISAGKMGCVLKFTVKEIDPSTGEAEEEGYEDEYQVRAAVGRGRREGREHAEV